MIRIMPILMEARKDSSYTGLVVVPTANTISTTGGPRTRSSLGPHHAQYQGAANQLTTAAAAGRKRPHSDTGPGIGTRQQVSAAVLANNHADNTRVRTTGQPAHGHGNQIKIGQGQRLNTARIGIGGDKKTVVSVTDQNNHSQFKTDCGFNVKLGQNRRLTPRDIYTPGMDVFPGEFFLFRRSRLVREDLKKQDHLSTLPDEMLLKVLKFLPTPALGKLAQVNKKFSRLVEDESLWRRVDCTGKILKGGDVGVLMKRAPMYLRLARACISDCKLPPTSRLSYLDLSMCIITPCMLNRLLLTCTKLQKLSLEHLQISPVVLETCLQFAPSLQTLNLAMCYGLDADQLSLLLFRCQKLTELNMGCVKQEWTRDELMSIMGSLPTGLEQLNMSGFRESVNDAHIKLMSTRCTRLFDLDLSDCQSITMISVEALSSLGSLQHLSLSRCYTVEPEAYSILANMKSLRYLELYSLFKESSVERLGKLLPGLGLNQYPFSAIARPTVGIRGRNGTIWGQRV